MSNKLSREDEQWAWEWLKYNWDENWNKSFTMGFLFGLLKRFMLSVHVKEAIPDDKLKELVEKWVDITVDCSDGHTLDDIEKERFFLITRDALKDCFAEMLQAYEALKGGGE